jgi:hypothetical protein
MGDFGAPYNSASHNGCRCEVTCSRDGTNKRMTNMRAIRGQRRQWLCFCGRLNASNTVLRPWLLIVLLSRAVSACLRSMLKKRASFSSQPRASSSRPEIAVVDTLHACDKKPPVVVARTVVGVPESLCHCSTNTFQTQAESSRSETWAASMRGTLCAAWHVSLGQERFLGLGRVDTKTSEIRGQRGPWLCFCERQTTAVSMLRPLLPKESHGQALYLSRRGHFSKNARVSRVSHEPRLPGQ